MFAKDLGDRNFQTWKLVTRASIIGQKDANLVRPVEASA